MCSDEKVEIHGQNLWDGTCAFVVRGRALVIEACQLGGDMPWTEIPGKAKAYKKGEFHTQQSSNNG